MIEVVWVGRAPGDSRLIKPFRGDVTNADEKRSIETDERNRRGEPLPAELFPKESYATRRGDKAVRMGRQPDLFQSDRWYVSAACAAVMREHDVGRGALYPVKLFQEDRRTPVEGECYCLNFGNTKEAFLPEQSPETEPSGSLRLTKLWWHLPSVPKDGVVAVSRAALAGPDIWIDPLLRLSFFVSDRLRAALKEAGVAAPSGLSRCRVIDAELDRSRLPEIFEQAQRHHEAAAAMRRAARAARKP